MSDFSLKMRRSDLLGLAYGALGTVFVQVGGQLYGSELLALTMVMLVGPLTIVRTTPALNSILAGYGILLVGLAFADLVNGSRTGDAIRGAANVIFAASNMLFLTYIFRRSTRAILFVLFGQGLSRLIGADATQEFLVLDNSNAFKARIVPILTPMILIAGYHLTKSKPAVAIWALFATGVLFILLEARSKGLVIILGVTAVVLLRTKFKPGQKVFVVAAVLALSYLLYVVYVIDVLATPSLSNSYTQLSRAANPYNPLSLLAEGRSEALVSLAAIWEQPIIGRGSWARDVTGRFSEMMSAIRGLTSVYYSPYIVGHSVVLTAWMWGGLLGLGGILIVGYSIFRRGLRVLAVPTPLQTVIAILFMDFVWNFLFSPFGHIRTSFPIIGAYILANAPEGFRRRSVRPNGVRT